MKWITGRRPIPDDAVNSKVAVPCDNEVNWTSRDWRHVQEGDPWQPTPILPKYLYPTHSGTNKLHEELVRTEASDYESFKAFKEYAETLEKEIAKLKGKI